MAKSTCTLCEDWATPEHPGAGGVDVAETTNQQGSIPVPIASLSTSRGASDGKQHRIACATGFELLACLGVAGMRSSVQVHELHLTATAKQQPWDRNCKPCGPGLSINGRHFQEGVLDSALEPKTSKPGEADEDSPR